MPTDELSLVSDPRSALRAEAAAWVVRLGADDNTPENQAAFQAWLEADPAHLIMFKSMSSMWGGLETFKGAPEVQKLVTTAKQPPALQSTKAGFSFKRHRVALSALAASLVLMISAGLLFLPVGNQDGVYTTAIGERSAYTLPDGSAVTLNTNSRLETVFTEAERRIRLLEGQAHFKVEHDATRTFVVEAGDGTITALGTEFDVYIKQDEVIVTLIEGKIAVTPELSAIEAEGTTAPMMATLSAGETVSYAHRMMADVSRANIERVTSWQTGRLVFKEDRLEDVLTEINRYSKRQLRIADPALSNILINASFKAGRVDQIATTLEVYFPIDARENPNGDIVLYHRDQRQ